MKTIYQGNDCEVYDTEGQALLADALHDSGTFLENYRKKEILKLFDDTFSFTKKPKPKPVEETDTKCNFEEFLPNS